MKTKTKNVIIILLALLVSVEVLMAITGGSNNNTKKPTTSVKNGNGLGVKTNAGGANTIPSWARNIAGGVASNVGGVIGNNQNVRAGVATAAGLGNPNVRAGMAGAGGGLMNVPAVRQGVATVTGLNNSNVRAGLTGAGGGLLNVPVIRNALFNAAAGGAMQYNDTPEGTPIVDGPSPDPQTLPGGYAFPFIDRGINGQKSIIPYNGMTNPLTSGGGFGTRYGGNWGGGGGGGYGGYDNSYLPAWYLNLVNWNIR